MTTVREGGGAFDLLIREKMISPRETVVCIGVPKMVAHLKKSVLGRDLRVGFLQRAI